MFRLPELLPRSSSLCDHPCKLAGTKCWKLFTSAALGPIQIGMYSYLCLLHWEIYLHPESYSIQTTFEGTQNGFTFQTVSFHICRFISSHFLLSYTFTSYPILSHAIPSHHILSHSILSHSIPSHPVPSLPVTSSPIPSNSILYHRRP